MKSKNFHPLVSAALFCLLFTPAFSADLPPHHALGREIFKELIETDTTHSTGDTTKAAEALARRFREAGFPAADIAIVGPNATNKNIVLRYRGTGAGQPILFLAHLDVVEAKREDWSIEPFKLTEKDGFFYGRGTSDDKDGDTSLSAAFIRLRREGFRPARDMILAMTAGEEAAADYSGVEWLLENKKDLIAASAVFNADAGGPQQRHGKNLLYTVPAAEKIYLSFKLEVKGAGGHSSKPTRDNAIYRLAEGLLRLSKYEFPVRLNEITRRYFEKMSAIETGPTAQAMKGILQTPPDPEAIRRLAESPFYNAILRTTAVATMVEAGHAENALPLTAKATVNCRLLPDESPADVEATLKRVLADDKISLTQIEPAKPSPASPLTPEIMQTIERAKSRVWGDIPVVPEMETGATDGLYFRQLGLPTYGIGGSATDLDDIRMHGKDERVGVKDFYAGLDFQYELIKSLGAATK